MRPLSPAAVAAYLNALRGNPTARGPNLSSRSLLQLGHGGAEGRNNKPRPHSERAAITSLSPSYNDTQVLGSFVSRSGKMLGRS
jgi:hypothetical protein